MLAMTRSATGSSASRVPAPESTPTRLAAPAARAISMSWGVSPTIVQARSTSNAARLRASRLNSTPTSQIG